MRIIGIDPGLRRLGWGVVNFDGSVLHHVANGICKTNNLQDLPSRLLELYLQLKEVISSHSPDCAAIENTFVNKDFAGALKLGQARGIALLAPAEAGLRIAEYAPNVIKKTIVGFGHADKSQLEVMVKKQLPGVKIEGTDAADALGIALCHAYQNKFKSRLEAAVLRQKVDK